MNDQFQCGENAALVGYMYGECDPSTSEAISAHLAVCAACTAEVAALKSTRRALARWSPPESSLGFRIVRPAEAQSPPLAVGTTPETRSRWYARPVPVWAQAVAAALIFSAGLSLGVMRGTAPGVAAPGLASGAGTRGAASTADLEALERRLRAEIARTPLAPVGGDQALAQAVSADQLLGRVRALIEESERRQQRELALRTAQVVRDFEAQRRVDLAQIQNSFGQIEGVTGAEVREQRQMLDYLIRVSQQR